MDPAAFADRLDALRTRAEELDAILADPAAFADPARAAALGREHAALRATLALAGTAARLRAEAADLDALARGDDPDLAALARAERPDVADRLERAEAALRLKLIPRPPEDARDCIVEVRAGTGGDEAALFAGDLFRLYERFAATQGWALDVFDSAPGPMGGFKEVVFALKGPDAYGTMKYESGVHRVQRVPATESQGRIHTSAATVAVLPEAEAVDVEVRPEDLRVDVYRASGAGGQHVNKTESAVRLTHHPTGVVVTCQDERSQHQNREKAMRMLRARLYEAKLEAAHAERADARRAMVSTGDRSAKVRTYNVPQDRLTDHRLDGDAKNRPLRPVLDGDLGPLVEALRAAEAAEV